jgi:hypothetical protein
MLPSRIPPPKYASRDVNEVGRQFKEFLSLIGINSDKAVRGSGAQYILASWMNRMHSSVSNVKQGVVLEIDCEATLWHVKNYSKKSDF